MTYLENQNSKKFFFVSSLFKKIGAFFKLSIGRQISYGILLGIVVGILNRFVNLGIRPDQFKVLGNIFLDLVKMTVAPLIFASISSAILSIEDLQKLGHTAFKGGILFFLTTFVGVIIGLATALIIKPGSGSGIDLSCLNIEEGARKLSYTATPISLKEVILGIIPDNIFYALYNGNLLQIIFFTIFWGIAIAKLRGRVHDGIIDFMHSFATVMYAMVKMVMRFAPFGIFGLVTWIFGSQDMNVMKSLMKLIFTSLVAMSVLVYIFYPLVLLIRFWINPLPFLRKMTSVQIFALATGSSAATLPMNIKNAMDRIGLSESSTKFLMPLGAIINMNGSGCSLAFYTVFIGQMYNVPLGLTDCFTIGILAFIGALGSPPVPGGAVIMLSGILLTLHYPLDAVSLILAVDKIIGPLRTAGNVTGDVFTPLYVDLSTNALDKGKYYAKN